MTTLEKDRPRSASVASPVGGGVGAFRLHVVKAVFKRNFQSYFSNPAGYVFITLFVIVCAWAAFWQPVFFANNLANLSPLNDWMPYLLLFFIPAITMNAWAEERRQGTDELLLTLPARDVEIVLGKFLAALGIYSAALLFSTSLVGILATLGSPDFGLLLATYFGYWLMGMLLVSIGMVASIISSNVTVAFILGAVFSAIPVFLGLAASAFPQSLRLQIGELSVPSQFQDFGAGVVPWVGVFYFVSLTAAMLYLNMVLVGRRHWAGGERSAELWLHSIVRVVCVVAALASVDVLMARWMNVRWDWSSEGLHRLSTESVKLVSEIPSDRTVYIQAYYSPEVPKDFVQTKLDVVNKLKEYAALGGDRVRLNLVETQLYSDEAREAEKRFGIKPQRLFTIEEARQTSSEFFLGVAFTSGPEEVVIPFFDRGLPVEYEITRSIRTVSRSGRKKVGILATDAKLLGGFDFRAAGSSPEWPIVTELKKQYEVSSISADSPIPTDLDALLVAQPSSLTQKQMDALTDYVKAGRPTLLFVDPLPLVDPQIAPELPRPAPGGPFGGGPPPEPKGNLTGLLDLIGVDWPSRDIVWNPYNPHPQMSELPPEIVFIGRGGAGDRAFNASQSATSGLQEVVMMFPGYLRMKGGAEFVKLLQVNDEGGTLPFDQAVSQGFMGISALNPNRRHFGTGLDYTLAARVSGKPAATPAPAVSKDEAKKDAKPEEAKSVNVIVVADLDMISEQFFDLRRRRVENLDFDNVTFVLNCVDVLAGDESYVDLRKRRLRHRTLERLEQGTREYITQAQQDDKRAEDQAKDQLEAAQKRLDEKVDTVRKRTDLDERTKDIMLSSLQEAENRRFEVEKAGIEDQKREKIRDSKADLEKSVRSIQNNVRMVAMIVPPLPALILGIFVFVVRMNRENQGANPNRLA